MNIIECPHCRTAVVAMEGGACPSCQQDTRTTPTESKPPGPESAWAAFQRTLKPNDPNSAMGRLKQFHKDHVALHSALLDGVRQSPASNLTEADRIRTEVLPWLDAELTRISSAPALGEAEVNPKSRDQIIDLLHQERAGWNSLGEAIQESDPSKLKEHVELWDRLELNLIGAEGASRSVSKPDAARLAQAFSAALVTFTPRLLALPTIIVANVAVFVIMLIAGMSFLSPDPQFLANWGANFGPRTMDGQWWRLAANLFLHFGIIHLGMNMWILWDVGRLLERLVGHVGFVVLYLVSGLAASVSSLAWHPTVVSAGASGAVFGVVGALLGFVALRRDTIPKQVAKHLVNSVGVFLAYNVFYGMKTSGIDHAAHVGGFVTGFCCGLILSQPLTLAMVSNRWWRNLIVGIAGIPTLLIACAALPAPPPDTETAMNQFAEVEEKALGLFNGLAERAQKDEVSDAEFADVIAKQILPPWAGMRLQLEALAKAYPDHGAFRKFVDYMNEREAAWQLYIDGSRESNSDTIERANQRMKAADEMAENMSAQ